MLDTHAHLDFESFDEDREKVIKRFFDDNGKAIINIGVDFERNAKSLKIASENPKIFSSLGFHPEEGEEIDLAEVEDYLRENCKNSKVVAIGEVGLDYFHTKDENKREFQKKLFVEQLEIAKDLKLPVIIHCRDAYEDLLKIISKPKFNKMFLVMHCFNANMKETERFLKIPNLKFSFTGNITFVKAESELLKIVKKIPLSRMMVETDCPFLAPVPNRGKRNEPSYVKFIIEKIAEVKQLSFEEIEKKTDKNAIEFFKIKDPL